MAKISLDRFQLQFISHQNEKMSYLDGIHEAITGLCGWVQLRMKDASDDEVRPIAYKVKEWCKIMNVTFIIDDRVELVKEVGADGRSEERRVGKECDELCRSRWSPYH